MVSHRDPIRNFAIGIGGATRGKEFHGIEIAVLPNVSRDVKLQLRFEGSGSLSSSPNTADEENQLFPGSAKVWRVSPNLTDPELRSFEFFIPDESVREDIYQQIAAFKPISSGPIVMIGELRRLLLFQVRYNDESYEAWLDAESFDKTTAAN